MLAAFLLLYRLADISHFLHLTIAAFLAMILATAGYPGPHRSGSVGHAGLFGIGPTRPLSSVGPLPPVLGMLAGGSLGAWPPCWVSPSGSGIYFR
jgi:hypothetical protein